ncbi:MAG: NAD-dependent DNA ligase LigA [Eubacterium sp.]|nr:NAD-dependent DNA ligase LigA [Eubacterium sp.]
MQETELQQMKELIRRMNEASDAYYNGRGELMTDFEWDALFDRLKKLEEKTGETLPDSPTQKVSEDNVPGQKEEHEFPALSLAKTKNPADLVKWAGGRPIWISWKLDGLTLVATYDDGKLTRLLTRGGGDVGTNITHLASAITGIPKKIGEKGHLVIRGEAVISYADFEQFLAESGEDYANPRNLASGSLSLKDVTEVRRRKIRWIPFTLVYTEREIRSMGDRMKFLTELGFDTVEREEIRIPDEEAVNAAIDRWTEKVTGFRNPYPVDGLVIAYDDTEYAASGSVTGHHATRAGLAFKWKDETAESLLTEIEWSCAVSTITPVAVFEPVELEGTTVKRASLCNVSECERLGIGGPGTRLEVIKSNKIIPKVVKILKTEGSLQIPDHCPVCGAETRIRVNPGSETRTLHCINPECTAKQLKKFGRFVSKDALDIDGISEQTLARFINAGWIREFADLFRLPEHRDEIVTMEGFGKRSMQKLETALEKSRETTGLKVLFGLCIPLCGIEVAKLFLSGRSFSDLIREAREAEDPNCFSSIAGIGPEKSSSFVNWMQTPKNAEILDNLLKELHIKEETVSEKGNVCTGLTFVVTGDVNHFKNRNELKTYIESQGGKVTGSVSRSTSYLINNDIQSTSGKNRKAAEYGIPVISEDMFLEKFGSD